MTAEATSCGICLEDYGGRRKAVKCQYCPASACQGCQRTFLLQLFSDPACFSCKQPWSADFMAVNFPLSFRNDALRKHRRRILLEREKQMLPAMQWYAEQKKSAETAQVEYEKLRKRIYVDPNEGDTKPLAALYTERRDAYHKALNQYNTEKARLGMNHKGGAPADVVKACEQAVTAWRAAKRAAHVKYDAVRKEYKELTTTLHEWGNQYARAKRAYALGPDADGGGAAGGAATAARREFIMKCPDNDCRGFLSSAYKCGTCSKWTCRDCLEVLGEDKNTEHTCDPGTVETAKTIRTETKPCPKCGTRIMKSEGCNQMWCTMDGCQTAFDWTTGQVVTGRVHNPHYYEWLRRNGGGEAPREAGDIPCGGMPEYWQVQRRLTRALTIGGQREVLFPYTDPLFARISETHRHLTELTQVRLAGFPAMAPANFHKEADCDYLLKRYDEDEWKRQLELKEAQFNRKREIGQILQMAAAAASELFQAIVARVDGLPATISREEHAELKRWVEETIWKQLEDLRAYVNESLRELAKRQHQAVPQFGTEWKWVAARALYRTAPKKRGGAAAGGAAGGVGLIGPTQEAEEEEVIELLDEDEPEVTAV